MHEFVAPFVALKIAGAVRTFGRWHFVKGFSYFAVFLAKEDLAQPMTVGSKQATHPDCNRQHRGPGQPLRETAVTRATVKTPDPGFGPAIQSPVVCPQNHLASRIKGMQARKNTFRFVRLVGQKVDTEGPLLSLDPLVKGAAHSTTPVVEHLDFLNMDWKVYFLFVLFFQDFLKVCIVIVGLRVLSRSFGLTEEFHGQTDGLAVLHGGDPIPHL